MAGFFEARIIPIRAFLLCAEHVQQLEGASPFDNLMEVKS
jgi:hypothetical protein